MRTVRFTLIFLALMITASAVVLAGPRELKPGQTVSGEKQIEWWGKAPGQRPMVEGVVANVSVTNIAVKTRNGIKPFTVNDKTKVIVRGQKASIGDVKVGDPVVVRFKLENNNVPTALAIRVPKPSVRGKIAAIEGNVLTLKGRDAMYRVLLTDKTAYKFRGYVGSINDLRVGYLAAAIGVVNGNEVTADLIEFVPALAKGTVVAVDGNTITVKTVRQLNIVLQPSNATVVVISPRVGPDTKGTLNDIKVGAPVDIAFHPNKNGPSPLLWIDILTGM